MSMVLCTLFIHIDSIPIWHNIYLIWTEYNSECNVHYVHGLAGVLTSFARVRHQANHYNTKTHNANISNVLILYK